MSKRIFVVQPPSRIDPETRKVVMKYDISSALQFGRLVYVLGHGSLYANRIDQAYRKIQNALHDFDSDDFILAIGDPVAIAMVAIIACQKTGGRVNMLRWNRYSQDYQVCSLNMKDA